MRIIKRFMLAALVICLLCSLTQVLAVSSAVTLQVKGTQDYSEAYDVLDLVNQYRAAEGLSALKMDEELMAAAMQRAAECSIYFSHTRPDGTDCFTAFPSKFTYGANAENIAIGQQNAADAMNSWMNSQGHYENIMNPSFNTIGIGCFYQDGILSWVQLFASRSGTAPSTRPTNTTVTANVNALPNNLHIICGIDGTEKLNYYDLYMYNLNTRFPHEYVELSNTDISFTSSDNNIIKVTNETLLEEVSVGTAILRGYINDIKVFEADYTVENIDHEHIYAAIVTPPTCTSGGYTTYTCLACGEEYIDDETDPIPHVYTETVVPPTHTSEGYTIFDCKNCAYYFYGDYTDPIPVTPPSEYILGDANGDGRVSNSDLIAMARYIVGLSGDIDLVAADFDKNGDITNTDLIAVARFIVGLV